MLSKADASPFVQFADDTLETENEDVPCHLVIFVFNLSSKRQELFIVRRANRDSAQSYWKQTQSHNLKLLHYICTALMNQKDCIN